MTDTNFPRLGWWKRKKLLRPYSIPVWWIAGKDRWEDLRQQLLAERGLTEEDVHRLYEVPPVPSPFPKSVGERRG